MTTNAADGEIDLSHEHLGLPTPAHVRQAAKDALDAGETHYTVRPGINPLRQAVAEKLARDNGIAVHPGREVLITCGEQEALFVAVHVLLDPGDEAILTGPSPAADGDLVAMARARPRVAVVDPDDAEGVDVDAVARLLGPRTRAILLRSPTLAGRVPGDATLEALAAIAIEHDLAVVAVETLEPFVHDGAVHHSIASIAGMANRTVTINGFAAVWGLEGWRVGYLAGPERLVAPMIQLKQALSICSPAVSQYAALAAVTGAQERLAAARALVGARLDALAAPLEAHGVAFVRPQAGCHALLDARGLGRDGAARAMQSAGVRGVHAAAIGLPGWLRLSLTAEPERLADAGRRLARALGPSATTGATR